MLLTLALRQHRWGNRGIWLESVTAFPWFTRRDAQTGKLPTALPPPVSAKRSGSKSQPSRGQGGGSRREHRDRERGEYTERPERIERTERTERPERTERRDRDRPTEGLHEKRPSQHRRPSMRDAPTRNEAPTYVYWMPHTAPDKAYLPDASRPPREKYYDRADRERNTSPRR